MGNRNSVNRQINTILSEMVVDIYIDQSISCQTILDLNQEIDIQSVPYKQYYVNINEAVESNPNCVTCIQSIANYQQIVLRNYQLLRDRGVAKMQPFPTLEQFLNRVSRDVQAQCAPVCKSLTVTNVSQELNLYVNVTCVSDVNLNANFYQTLEVELFQRMVNDKDFRSILVTSFTGGNVTEQINNLLSEVKYKMQVRSQVKMDQLMLLTQNLNIRSNGATVINNVSQSAMRTVMVEGVYKAIFDVEVVKEDNYQIVQELIDKMASLKDIAATAGNLGQTWIDSLSSAWQAVLFVAIGVVIITCIVWIALSSSAYVKAEKDLDFAKKNGCKPPESRPPSSTTTTTTVSA